MQKKSNTYIELEIGLRRFFFKIQDKLPNVGHKYLSSCQRYSIFGKRPTLKPNSSIFVKITGSPTISINLQPLPPAPAVVDEPSAHPNHKNPQSISHIITTEIVNNSNPLYSSPRPLNKTVSIKEITPTRPISQRLIKSSMIG